MEAEEKWTWHCVPEIMFTISKKTLIKVTLMENLYQIFLSKCWLKKSIINTLSFIKVLLPQILIKLYDSIHIIRLVPNSFLRICIHILVHFGRLHWVNKQESMDKLNQYNVEWQSRAATCQRQVDYTHFLSLSQIAFISQWVLK